MAYALVFWTFFAVLVVPFAARASFLSSLLGDSAEAETTPAPLEIQQNSQKMALLEANSSVAPVFKGDSKTKDTDPFPIEAFNDTQNISNNALVPSVTPVSDGIGGFDDLTSPTEQISVYVVRKGDTLAAIAKMFEVSENTIRWANNMKKGEKLLEGNILAILPVDGVEHTVTKGQTLASIAKLYKADVTDIAELNGLAVNEKLAVDDVLIVPDGVKSEESDKPIKNLSASIAKDKAYYDSHPVQNLAGYYINPVPGARKSQGLHDKNGIDLAIAKGTPILAAAEGRVKLARIGYNGGFGNLVIISHPNGTETLYAHMSKLGTTTGAQVYQGQTIGYVGSTGRSTGPHLHLEVHGARNPGTDGSWKY